MVSPLLFSVSSWGAGGVYKSTPRKQEPRAERRKIATCVRASGVCGGNEAFCHEARIVSVQSLQVSPNAPRSRLCIGQFASKFDLVTKALSCPQPIFSSIKVCGWEMIGAFGPSFVRPPDPKTRNPSPLHQPLYALPNYLISAVCACADASGPARLLIKS